MSLSGVRTYQRKVKIERFDAVILPNPRHVLVQLFIQKFQVGKGNRNAENVLEQRQRKVHREQLALQQTLCDEASDEFITLQALSVERRARTLRWSGLSCAELALIQ